MFSLNSPLFPTTQSTSSTPPSSSSSRHRRPRRSPIPSSSTSPSSPSSSSSSQPIVVASFQQSQWESASFSHFANALAARPDNNDDDDDYDAYVRRQAAANANSSAATLSDASRAASEAAPLPSVADSMAVTRHAKRGNPLRSQEYSRNAFCLTTGAIISTDAAAGGALAAPAAPALDPDALFRIPGDGFVRRPTPESAELLISFPQSVFDQIVLGLNPKPLRLVCRRWLSMFRSLRVHWLADSADRAIDAQLPRLESLVMLDLSHTNVSAVGLATITRCAASLAFLDLAHCIGLNDAAVTCDLLACATRLRQIDLTGIAVAPPVDAVAALTRITRLQRLAWHDGVREFFAHAPPSSQPLPSLGAVTALLAACPALRIQFKTDLAHSSTTAEAAAVQAPNSRMAFVLPHALKVLQRWPSCTTCARACYKSRVDAETRQPLVCDICNARPVGTDHIVCMQHVPRIVHCKFCHDASTQ